MNPPKIDDRTAAEIRQQVAALAEEYSDWRRGEEPDLGMALMEVFGRYAEIIINRLNRAPQKNFRAFLNLIGAEPAPPRPARVPLTFTPAENSPANAPVPAGTQVAAPPQEGEEEEVTFETERNLVVTPAQLVRMIIHNPEEDAYRALSGEAWQKNGSLTLFAASDLLPHEIYLGSDALLSASGEILIQFEMPDTQLDRWRKLPLSWSYWDKEMEDWLPLEQTLMGKRDFNVFVPASPKFGSHTIQEVTSGWIRIELARLLPSDPPPPIKEVSLSIGSFETRPSIGFQESTRLDVSRDFYPFGQFPQTGSTLFLGGSAVLQQAGAKISVRVELRNAPYQLGKPEVVWEGWNGSEWQELLLGSSGAAAFLENGKFDLTLPQTIAETTVNGESDLWLRARLISGNYGKVASLQQIDESNQSQKKKIRLQEATLKPPVIANVTFYHQPGDTLPNPILLFNDFRFEDVTEQNRGRKSVKPFKTTLDSDPALYLGFDRPFTNQPVSLYVDVDPPSPETVGPTAMKKADADAPHIVWEYLAADGAWRNLGAADETAAFSRRGMIRFLGPADLAKRPLFGETLCWLRARLAGGRFPTPPRLRRVLTNTVWAIQATTSRREILGAGAGEPGQTFHTAQTPVLPGCRVLVREPALSLEAANQLGADVERDEAGQVSDIWVPWTAVADFYASGPADRRVVVDAQTGEVRFGDGRHGRLPPTGQNNIRITYRSGGGEQGNLPAGTITELKSSLPYIESVANPVASSGGGDAQAPASVQRYGPRRLRHRGRAVAGQDLEDLAFAASTQVARAQAIMPQFDPLRASPTTGGGVGLIIVPRGEGKRPTPDLGLIEQVEAYLRARCPATAALRVSGPIWRRVDVTLTAVPLSPASADQLAQNMQNRLDQFLHPLSGGAAGKGWPFSRRPQPSDLYGALHGLPGLDHVRTLSLKISGDAGDATLPFLIYPGAHSITMVVD